MAKVAPFESAELKVKEAGKATASGRRGSAVSLHSEQPHERHRVSGLALARYYARNVLHRSGWYDSPLATSIRKILRGRVFVGVTMVCLVIALFLGELFAIFQVPTNTALDIVLTAVFAVFLLEFLGLSLTDTSYLFGFFFWMDLLGTASMAFDISFMFGEDATEPDRVHKRSTSGSESVTFVRAARAARLGARAGRISRVLKILRFLPFLLNSSHDDAHKVKMARVISNQLTNGLSTRVAFLTICVVVFMLFLSMFSYPEVDHSMAVWAELLNQNAMAFHAAWLAGNASGSEELKARLLEEVQRFSAFYAALSYGPYDVEFGESAGEDFVARTDILDVQETFFFEEPRRKSSIRIVSQDMVRVFYDLSTPKSREAGMSIGLICFTIIVMCCFGMFISSSISVVALQPLERMLSVVRQRCAQIFRYTSDLEEAEADAKEEDDEEFDQDTEFMLLEKVVAKLAAIAHLSTAAQEPEVKAGMNEGEIVMLNWMQGAQVPVAGRPSDVSKGAIPSAEVEIHTRIARVSSSAAYTMPPDLLEEMGSANFNALDLSKEMRVAAAAHFVTAMGGCSAWVHSNVRESQLMTFISLLESKYVPNPFHNFAHAVDVEFSVCRYMHLIAPATAPEFLPETSQFWMLIAAVAHDVGHPGVNNQYLIETSHELALRYNDRSPLENMHTAKLFQIAAEPEANVFAQVEKDLYKEMRKGIIVAVLHTDVTKHNEMLKDMSLLYQMNSEAFDAMEPGPAVMQSHANVQLIINSLLHGADIGNPMKPWDLCHRYAYLCLDEYFAQGDLEKAAGIPVQMLNDREKVNRPNSQVGFIEFVVSPMVTTMVNLFPQLDSLALYLGENIQHWNRIWQQEHKETLSEEAIAKVEARVQKVVDSCNSLLRQNA